MRKFATLALFALAYAVGRIGNAWVSANPVWKWGLVGFGALTTFNVIVALTH